MIVPKVFISYSHDDIEHKKWVLDLATGLRNNGVESIIDQWELRPGDDLPKFMEENLSNAEYVIMVCTDMYVQKANCGKGGVGYEKMIITAEYLNRIDSSKVIPIVRNNPTKIVPVFMKSKLFIDFNRDDEFEYSYDELVRTIHKSPLFEKPKVGNNPFKPIEESRPNRNDDSLILLMKHIIMNFESSAKNYVLYSHLVKNVPMSRIYLDRVLQEAVDKGLIRRDSEGDVILTNEGKYYGIQHRLVTEYN